MLVACHIIAICDTRFSDLQGAYIKSRNVLESLRGRIPYTLNIKISVEKWDNVGLTTEEPLGRGPVHI